MDPSAWKEDRNQHQRYGTPDNKSDNQLDCVRGWHRRMMNPITTGQKSALQQLVSKFVDLYQNSSPTASDKNPPQMVLENLEHEEKGR